MSRPPEHPSNLQPAAHPRQAPILKPSRKWGAIGAFAFGWGTMLTLLMSVLRAVRSPEGTGAAAFTANLVAALIVGWVIGIPLGYLFWRQLSRRLTR